LADIWLTEPSGARMAQFKDMKLRKGIVQMEYQLGQEPALGKWTLHLKASNIFMIS